MAQISRLRLPESKESLQSLSKFLTAIGFGMFVATVFMTYVAMTNNIHPPIGAMVAAGLSAGAFGFAIHVRTLAKRV